MAETRTVRVVGLDLSMTATGICGYDGDTVTVKVAPREGSFAAWWTALHVEVYGGPGTMADAGDGTLATYNAQRQAMVATIPDSGKGTELTLKYSR